MAGFQATRLHWPNPGWEFRPLSMAQFNAHFRGSHPLTSAGQNWQHTHKHVNMLLSPNSIICESSIIWASLKHPRNKHPGFKFDFNQANNHIIKYEQ